MRRGAAGSARSAMSLSNGCRFKTPRWERAQSSVGHVLAALIDISRRALQVSSTRRHFRIRRNQKWVDTVPNRRCGAPCRLRANAGRDACGEPMRETKRGERWAAMRAFVTSWHLPQGSRRRQSPMRLASVRAPSRRRPMRAPQPLPIRGAQRRPVASGSAPLRANPCAPAPAVAKVPSATLPALVGP
jgi:hypothetical protein